MRGRKLLVVALVCVGTAGCSLAKAPGPQKTVEPASVDSATKPPAPLDPAPIDWNAFNSTSMRNPNDGSLRGGVPLPMTAAGFRFNADRNPEGRYDEN